MNNRHITDTCEADIMPITFFELLADPKNLPKWAPAFADAISEGVSGEYIAMKHGGEFTIRVIANAVTLTVDYLREVAPGSESGAYLRVIPRNGGGSVIVMTLPMPADRDVGKARDTLQRELDALVTLALCAAATGREKPANTGSEL